jgi:hypothetical protein
MLEENSQIEPCRNPMTEIEMREKIFWSFGIGSWD